MTARGTANIMIYGVNTGGTYLHSIVSGVIGDYGPAASIYPNGQVDPAHNSEPELRLTDGSPEPAKRAANQDWPRRGPGSGNTFG